MTERLERTVTVTLGAGGAGSATLGPGRQAERWSVTRMTTAGTAATEPALVVYRGTSGKLDGTPHGNDDVSETDSLEVLGGEFLTASYTGGTPGAAMTFRVEGELSYGLS